ncbi:protein NONRESPONDING TO OXYLIPINS 2, mitochondrial-like [Prosopis cineraria]|uniref:protein NONRESPONDING TO OXYLIPINS 2, mitochondrial-like n=1 Tax=Prosopis cineraria TaxID=364024 RepID=UPI002410AC92|nr:protein NONRESPONDING TO OXYLIPINS 2, mitochondrial-like [Prosopis cineraria]
MALRGGSLSRSIIAAARTFSNHSSPPSISRLRRPPCPLRSYLLDSRRPLIAVPRTLGLLGCAQSLLPLHSAIADAHLTSHISIKSRACCELSQGT